jgi:hypothetical protein
MGNFHVVGFLMLTIFLKKEGRANKTIFVVSRKK